MYVNFITLNLKGFVFLLILSTLQKCKTCPEQRCVLSQSDSDGRKKTKLTLYAFLRSVTASLSQNQEALCYVWIFLAKGLLLTWAPRAYLMVFLGKQEQMEQ